MYRGNTSQHHKDHLHKPIANIKFKVGKLVHEIQEQDKDAHPLTQRQFKMVLAVLAIEIKQEREIKIIQIGKEEVKLSFLADDMILYIENTKESMQKPLGLKSKFSKVEEYKIKIQKFIAFLYTHNEISERESKK